ncbi:tRNA(fMet)-specific endonuclease VapC [Isoptericola jiangsuensis]|uniref:Ribonuclease VapC n=1 Tax=Isoptericola jiangsuensis TaxID=548579 RepID=A0A2A9EVM3_9MICO|nr:type II toxin-antitoxin system VapC family toxin [Isoptericola jiangsuensis]PFG42616.1 tRNA(fMet)-specific endonuclease VapC [Isoptericola jiangsuensis]
MILLDTGVLIAIARSRRPGTPGSLPDEELAVAAITVAEVREGVERFKGSSHYERQREVESRLLAAVTVLDYTYPTAVQHGRLLAHTRSSGEPRGAHDLIVAAHAAQTGLTLYTTDARANFSGLPGVSSVTVTFR